MQAFLMKPPSRTAACWLRRRKAFVDQLWCQCRPRPTNRTTRGKFPAARGAEAPCRVPQSGLTGDPASVRPQQRKKHIPLTRERGPVELAAGLRDTTNTVSPNLALPEPPPRHYLCFSRPVSQAGRSSPAGRLTGLTCPLLALRHGYPPLASVVLLQDRAFLRQQRAC